jgi:hypothetical protein
VTEDLHAPTTAAPTPGPATHAGATTATGGEDAGGPSTADKLTGKVGEAREKLAGGAGSAGELTDERPEILVGAAFAGGFVAAMILKRLGR